MAAAAAFRKIIGATALVLVSVIITLALAEMVLRFTPYAKLRVPNYTYPEDYFVADDVLGYDIAPNVQGKSHSLPAMPYELFSNRYGCFDYDRDVPQDYTLILGDSMTWGYAPLEKKWTTRLEELSGEFMAKCGVTGYGTKQELLKGKKVIEQIGHTPKRIIVMYIVNDLNDDYLMPQRTVYGGKLISWINNLDLKTGEINRRSADEIARKNAKYKDGTWSNTMREWRHGLVVYRLFKIGKERFSDSIAQIEEPVIEAQAMRNAEPQKPQLSAASESKELPETKTESVYRITLAGYLDTDRPWFNAAIDAHKQNILSFISYADSINAKLLFIDPYGLLQHTRFDAVRTAFADAPRHSYYNLQDDYYPFDTWENDAHWNIIGNQTAAKHIHAHAQAIDFYKD
ncbi:MAG: hypothetical protein MK052_06415 [Alphaproteobacteria bacterium]|nr:hypothetical protein [Alphaproteobacteria bacterium]